MTKYLILKSPNKANVGVIVEKESEIAPNPRYYKFESESEIESYKELDQVGKLHFIERILASNQAPILATPQKKSVQVVEAVEEVKEPIEIIEVFEKSENETEETKTEEAEVLETEKEIEVSETESETEAPKQKGKPKKEK